jgi:cytochrome-b5 reductase
MFSSFFSRSAAAGLGAGVLSALAFAEPEAALSAKEFRAFTLIDSEDLTHNTKRFRFALPHDTKLGMTVASSMACKAEVDGKNVVRPYTPTTKAEQLGYFDLVVKKYPDGKMGGVFWDLKKGDDMLMKGPFKKIEYTRNMKKSIGMIAGGTGITPMLQVIIAILNDPRDKTEVRLLYANETEGDIMLKKELDALAAKHPNFKVTYTVSKGGEDWNGYTGYVNQQMVAETLPAPSDDTLIMVCGPPPMMKAICGPKGKPDQPGGRQGLLDGLLKGMKYDSSNVFKF